MIGGPGLLNVAKLYDMIHPNASGGKRLPRQTRHGSARVFIIGPDKKVKAMRLIYSDERGDEISTRFCVCSIHCS